MTKSKLVLALVLGSALTYTGITVWQRTASPTVAGPTTTEEATPAVEVVLEEAEDEALPVTTDEEFFNHHLVPPLTREEKRAFESKPSGINGYLVQEFRRLADKPHYPAELSTAKQIADAKSATWKNAEAFFWDELTLDDFGDELDTTLSLQQAVKLHFERYLSNYKQGARRESYMYHRFTKPKSAKDPSHIPYSFSPYLDRLYSSVYGRWVRGEYFFENIVYQSDEIVAVVYREKRAFETKWTENNVYLKTYTTAGRPIDELRIACTCKPTHLEEALVTGNTVAVTEYTPLWKYKVGDTDISQNTIIGKAKTGTTTWRIAADGTISSTTAVASR